MFDHQPNEAEKIKPQISRLQSAVQKWRNKQKELENFIEKENDESNENEFEEPPHKRRKLNKRSGKDDRSTTESISLDNDQTNFVINSLMDQVTQLQGQISGLQTLTQQQNENAKNEIKNLRAQLQQTADNVFHPSTATSFPLQDIFQRPTLSKFSSTVSPNIDNSDTVQDNIPRDNQPLVPVVSNAEKLDIKKKSNQTRLNLALKLNFKFNNKAPKLTIEALKFRNNVKNWERIGRTVLGWTDDCALLSVKLAFTDVSDFNDFQIKSASTMQEFYDWFDHKYNISNARQELYEIISKWKCPRNITLAGVVPKYLEDLDLFQGTAEAATPQMLALTPFNPIDAVMAVRNSLPLQWKRRFDEYEQRKELFISNLEDLHSAFIVIEQQMRTENLKRKDDTTFTQNMIVYSDVTHNNNVNFTQRNNMPRQRQNSQYFNSNRNNNNNYSNFNNPSYFNSSRAFHSNRNYRNRGGFNNIRGRGRARGRRDNRSYRNFPPPHFVPRKCNICQMGGHTTKFHHIISRPEHSSYLNQFNEQYQRMINNNNINVSDLSNSNRNQRNTINKQSQNRQSNNIQSHSTIITSNLDDTKSKSVIDGIQAEPTISTYYNDPVPTQRIDPNSMNSHSESSNSRNQLNKSS